MQEKTHILDRVSSFSLLLTMIILMIIGAALIPLVDVGSSPKPRQGKTLTISYGWRNASPKVVEQEVTSKIEGLVSAVKGVAEVSSESYFGSGRVTVDKYGGNLGASGCVSYMFDDKGVIILLKEDNEGVDEDALMEAALEAGAEEIARRGFLSRTDGWGSGK